MSDDDDYYADDFEDYENDFEDDESDVGAAPVTRTLSAALSSTRSRSEENSLLASTYPSPSLHAAKAPRNSGYVGKGFLPSKAALGPSDAERAVLQKRAARWKILIPKIRLDVSEWDCMFEMAPMSPYDLYLRGMGPFANKRVASTQTGEDVHAEEVQTDEIEEMPAACQVPDDLGRSRWELEHAEAGNKPKLHAGRHSENNVQGVGKAKMTTFVKRATQMMITVLTGQTIQTSPSLSFTSSCCFNSISNASFSLAFECLLRGRPVCGLSIGNGSQPLVLVAYGSPILGDLSNKDAEVSGQGCLCVWDLSSPGEPVCVLLSRGNPSCCCWNPGDTQYLAFAGMEEGGVCMWDLREIDNAGSLEGFKQAKALRPVYTTEYAPDHDSSGDIVAVSAVDSSPSTSEGKSELEKKWRSLRGESGVDLICLTAWGHTKVYMVKELTEMDSLSAQETDYGLRIGGRVRLAMTTSGLILGKQAGLRSSNASPHIQPTPCLQPFPDNPNHFLVGSDGGRILRGAALGSLPTPKEYSASQSHSPTTALHKSEKPFESVLSIDFCPTIPNLFLSARSNGKICLHDVNRGRPLNVWESFGDRRFHIVRWLPSRASLFFAIDSASQLHCFDLLGESGRERSVGLMKDGKHVTQCEVLTGDCECLVVGYADGEVQVHRLIEEFSLVEGEEMERVVDKLRRM